MNIPEELLPFIGRRGLPLKSTPVAPNERARIKAKDAKTEAEASEIVQLQDQLKSALEGVKVAQDECEKHQQAAAAASKALEETEARENSLIADLQRSEEERAALEETVREQAETIARLEAKADPEESSEEEDDGDDEDGE